jgi:hypothetical protein
LKLLDGYLLKEENSQNHDQIELIHKCCSFDLYKYSDCAILLIKIIGTISERLNILEKSKLVETDFIAGLIGFLHVVVKLYPRMKLNEEKSLDSPGFGLKCDVMRILANLSYQSPHIQEEVNLLEHDKLIFKDSSM